MNFQKIPPVGKSDEWLEQAFKKARQRGKSKNLQGNWLQIIRKKEGLKLDIVKDVLVIKLDKILTTFPGLGDLPPFYVRLLKLSLDYVKLKQSLGAVNWAREKIRKLHGSYVRQIVKEKERDAIKALSKQFYGRTASFLKQIKENLDFLEQARLKMRTLPDIKDMFTVCLYGFPNVGKTTLLNTLTGSTAKTASYAFTTLGINVGYFMLGEEEVQVLDVPGTLAREKMNDVEKIAELVVEDVADIIVYVFDISERCGYSMQDQEKLFSKVKSEKIVFVSKRDLEEVQKGIKDFSHEFFDVEGLKEEIVKKMNEQE